MWTIHVQNGALKGRHGAPDLPSALAVAAVLLREGLTVESIDGPDGMSFDAAALRAMLELSRG